MGLTIHYSLSAAVSTGEARAVIDKIRARARRLRFTGIEDVAEFRAPALHVTRETLGSDPQWWLKVRTGYCLTREGGDHEYRSFDASHAIAFMCWPGDTEPSCFGLCRYQRPRRLPAWAQTQAERIGLFEGFHWQSFCKTQYASSPRRGGMRGFLAAHTRLVRLLDYANELGVLREVNDDSGYWLHRDRKRLAAEVQRWNRIVATVVGGIGDAVGARGKSPIRDYPNYEHLEAEGRKELSGE